MGRNNFLINVIAIIIIVSNNGLTRAHNYYVAKYGKDSNPGSKELPFATLEQGVKNLLAGDSVIVEEGIYKGFRIRNLKGTKQSWIVIKAMQSHKVIINSHLNHPKLLRAIEVGGECKYVEINGFEITDSNLLYKSDKFEDYNVGSSRDAIKIYEIGSELVPSYIRIVNNHIYNIGKSGIYSSYISHHIEIINNHIHDVGLCKRGYGLYIGGDNHLIKANRIHDSYGFGIHIYSEGGPTPDSIVVENNIIHNNGRKDYGDGLGGKYPQVRGDGIIVSGSGKNNIIRNNLCFMNIECGIRVDSRDCLVANNTLYMNGRYGIEVYDFLNCKIINNVCYKNYISYNHSTEMKIGLGNIANHNLNGVNPKFKDASNMNFEILKDSPAIDSGTNIDGFNYDLRGIKRPQGHGWDIGAFEISTESGLNSVKNIKKSQSNNSSKLLQLFN